MKKTDNIGVEGVESIRIGEMLIGDLPIAESAIAKHQLPIAEDTERQNKINNILAGYPKHSIEYIDGRIRECETNIDRIGQMKVQQSTMISEYTSQISLCKFRDDEIARIPNDDPEKDQKIRDLNKRFPPYNVTEMQKQIVQSSEAVDRADDVIAQEYKSIAELRELKGLCEQRDLKLRHLGAKIVGK